MGFLAVCPPVGRPHIYPPLLHIVMASFIKAGLSPAITGKIFEFILPPAFLFALWHFLKRSFNRRVAFFSLALSAASFGFYINLAAHPASTLAMVFGLSATESLLRGRRTAVGLMFLYSHSRAVVFCGSFFKPRLVTPAGKERDPFGAGSGIVIFFPAAV
ncbi:MAG: hypothetical protein WC469_05120 [Candidatus Omnitrophota bacterium]